MSKAHTEKFEFYLSNNREDAVILFYRDNAWISFQDLAKISCLTEDKLIEILGELLKTREIMDRYIFLYYLPAKKDLYGMEEPPEYIEFYSLEVAIWLQRRCGNKTEILDKYTNWASGILYDQKKEIGRPALVYILAYGISLGLAKMVSVEAGSIILAIAVAIIFLAIRKSILFFLGTIFLLLIAMFIYHSIAILILPIIAVAFIVFGSLKSRGTTQFTHTKEPFAYGYENLRSSVLGIK